MARQPNSQTFELGHWESAQISYALSLLIGYINEEDSFKTDSVMDPERIEDLKNLETMFSFGTHSVTQKLEEQ